LNNRLQKTTLPFCFTALYSASSYNASIVCFKGIRNPSVSSPAVAPQTVLFNNTAFVYVPLFPRYDSTIYLARVAVTSPLAGNLVSLDRVWSFVTG
jgi:hypothetical protein